MSTPYTPSPTYHSQIDVTVDGDDANASEFNTPYQQCADNAAFCRGVIDPLINGGTLTPSAKLFLNQSFQINGGNSLTVTGGIECFGFFECLSLSGSHFAGDMTCDAAVNCATLSVSGSAAITGNVTAGGSVVATGTVAGALLQANSISCFGTLSVLGSSALSDISSAGAVSLTGSVVSALNFSGIGRPRIRSVRGVDVASITYAPYYNIISFPNMASVDRTATVDTGGGQGDWMIVCVDPTAHALTINFPGGATATFPASTLKTQAALFAFIGSAWIGPLFQIISDV